MSIMYHGAIIHVLDLSVEQPVISKGNLDIYDENEKFITRHVMNLFENNYVSPAQFKEESQMLDLIVDYEDDKFLETSKRLATRFYNYMSRNGNIPSGDLLVVQFIKEEVKYMAILKLNYKEEFSHYINPNNGLGGVTELIKHKAIFPSSRQSITEAVLVDLDTRQLRVLDKSKEQYLSDLFEIDMFLSIKEQIQVVEEATFEVIEENFENPTEALSTFKQNVAESIFQSSEIPIKQIIEDTFGNYDKVKEECVSRMADYGFHEDNIIINNSRDAKKYTSHKIKTNTGIEIKLPTEMAKDENFIEFITNPDGTISIILKNIGQILSR
ncbi:MAG: hypothetical protein ATN33_04470 [Epulopiscium sp. Nele67-Bin001]|nr:MAG: hypothetical protein ATN33_04470 [Epulopiscium sp. Nele67-Bin001]